MLGKIWPVWTKSFPPLKSIAVPKPWLMLIVSTVLFAEAQAPLVTTARYLVKPFGENVTGEEVAPIILL